MNRMRTRDVLGRLGWRYRFQNPLTRKQNYKTFWYRSLRVADQAYRAFRQDLENEKLDLQECTD